MMDDTGSRAEHPGSDCPSHHRHNTEHLETHKRWNLEVAVLALCNKGSIFNFKKQKKPRESRTGLFRDCSEGIVKSYYLVVTEFVCGRMEKIWKQW